MGDGNNCSDDDTSQNSLCKIGQFKCIVCDYVTTTQSRLIEHTIAKHANDEEREKFMKKCPMCDYASLRTSCIKLHFERVHEKKTNACDWEGCSFETGKIKLLKEHIASIHEGVKYICSDCGFETSTTRNLQKHIKTYHMNNNDASHATESLTDSVSCDREECDFKTSAQSTLAQHISAEHGDTDSSINLVPKEDIKEEANDFDYIGEHHQFVKTILDENEEGIEFKSFMDNIEKTSQQHSASKRKHYKC